MSTSAIVGIVIVVVVIAVIAAVAGRILVQRRELRERYGDEYQRVVTEKGGRAAAEAELKRREREHEKLQLNELSPEVRDRYRSTWTGLQGQFVDDPKAAVHAADQLVSELVAERGYPVVDYSDRLAHLSVEHASVLNTYRAAHDISVRNDAGTASTEELRQALVHYRELVADLLGDESLANGATTASSIANGATTGVIADSDATLSEVPAPATPPELRADSADTDYADTQINGTQVDGTQVDGTHLDGTPTSSTDIDDVDTDAADLGDADLGDADLDDARLDSDVAPARTPVGSARDDD